MSFHPAPREYAELELLLDGVLTGPLTLAVPSELATMDRLELTDAEGTPVALLTVTDKQSPASATRGEPGDRTAITGSVEPLRPREDGLFRHLRLTPAEVAARYPRVASLVVDRPLDQGSIASISLAGKGYDAIALLPVMTEDGALGPATLVRATLAAADLIDGETLVIPVPLPDPLQARKIAAAYGTPLEVARSEHGELPRTVLFAVRKKTPRGLVVFFTGLSGSGKSTLARRLRDELLEHDDRSVTLLDGDVVRRMLSAGLGFSRADREANVRRIGFVASEVARAGGIAICAPIAPYESTRAEVRAMAAAAGADFVLVHVSTPLEECERRDRKGLYAKARAGEIPEFTGISDPYEAPDDADVTIDTSTVSLADALSTVTELVGGFRSYTTANLQQLHK